MGWTIQKAEFALDLYRCQISVFQISESPVSRPDVVLKTDTSPAEMDEAASSFF